MRHLINATKDAILFADKQIQYALATILAPYGNEGMELPSHDDGTYFVTAEMKPNEFTKVIKVRCVESIGKVEMMIEGSNKWEWCAFVDWRFLFEEVAHTYSIDKEIGAIK